MVQELDGLGGLVLAGYVQASDHIAYLPLVKFLIIILVINSMCKYSVEMDILFCFFCFLSEREGVFFVFWGQ